MLYFSNPYSLNKKILEAYDHEIMRLPSDDDWVCLRDGDTAFLRHDYGHTIQRYIDQYQDTGIFTCYASRCHYRCQVLNVADMENDSILFHHQRAVECATNLKGQIVELDRKIAGHLMVIRKSTWKKVRGNVFKRAAGKNILGVDTQISKAMLSAGFKIRLMRELYILHYLRLAEGFDCTKHLE